nr:f-box protein [Quercus suber]
MTPNKLRNPSEEARIAKEVEAHEIRIRKELEKQDILRFGSDSIVNCLPEPIPRELLDLSLEVNLPHSRKNVQHRPAFGEESLKLPVLDEGNHEQQEPNCEQQETREGVGGLNQELVVRGGAQKLRGSLDHVVIIGASEDGLLSVAKECHLISFVDGFFGSVVSDIGLTILAQGCRRLVRLELCGCEGSYDGIKAIGQCCQMLEELTLSDHKMDGGWLAAVSFCGNLKILKLQSCKGSIDSEAAVLLLLSARLPLVDISNSQGSLTRTPLPHKPSWTRINCVPSEIENLFKPTLEGVDGNLEDLPNKESINPKSPSAEDIHALSNSPLSVTCNISSLTHDGRSARLPLVDISNSQGSLTRTPLPHKPSWTRINCVPSEIEVNLEVHSGKKRAQSSKRGDRNSKYFHTRASQCFHRNRIVKLRNTDGALVLGDANVSAMVLAYYKNLFSSSRPNEID